MLGRPASSVGTLDERSTGAVREGSISCEMESSDVDALRAEALRALALLRSHDWLLNARVATDFVADDLFSRLPDGWGDALLELGDEELTNLPIALPLPPRWPAALRALVEAARAFSVPPHEIAEDSSVNRWLLQQVPNTRNMGPKKRHECLRLAPCIARVCADTSASAVVDLGSGLGYLSHVLAFHHGLKVVGLEASEANAAGAATRAERVLAKMRPGRDAAADALTCEPCDSADETDVAEADGEGAAAHVARPSPTARAAAAFRRCAGGFRSTRAARRCSTRCGRRCGSGGSCSSGLHACGDLSPTLLRCFAEGAADDDAVAGVVSVGCCYHRVTQARLPLSSTLREATRAAEAAADAAALPAAPLSESARHLAVQAVRRWPPPHTPIKTTRQRWRQHLWRCVLELQIRAARRGEEESELAHGWMPRDGNVGPTPAHVASFEAYAAVALERLGLPAADPAALAALWQRDAGHERRLAAFVARARRARARRRAAAAARPRALRARGGGRRRAAVALRQPRGDLGPSTSAEEHASASTDTPWARARASRRSYGFERYFSAAAVTARPDLALTRPPSPGGGALCRRAGVLILRAPRRNTVHHTQSSRYVLVRCAAAPPRRRLDLIAAYLADSRALRNRAAVHRVEESARGVWRRRSAMSRASSSSRVSFQSAARHLPPGPGTPARLAASSAVCRSAHELPSSALFHRHHPHLSVK